MIGKEAEGFLDALLLSVKSAKMNILCVEEIIESSEDYAALNAFKNIKLQAELLQSNVEFLLENTEDYDRPFCGEGGL